VAQLAAQLLDCQARLRSAQAEVDRRRRLDIERCGLEALEAGERELARRAAEDRLKVRLLPVAFSAVHVCMIGPALHGRGSESECVSAEERELARRAAEGRLKVRLPCGDAVGVFECVGPPNVSVDSRSFKSLLALPLKVRWPASACAQIGGAIGSAHRRGEGEQLPARGCAWPQWCARHFKVTFKLLSNLRVVETS
jgi:hypothetical protein